MPNGLVALLVSFTGCFVGFVIYVQSDIGRATAFINRLATLLPCHVEGTANNALIATMKISNYKSGQSFDNYHDLELFPFWFTKIAESLGPKLWSANLSQSMGDRTNFYHAGLRSDVESGSVKQFVYVGSGFDTLLLKHAEDPDIIAQGAQFYELDLPNVATAKVCLLNRRNAEVAGRFHHLEIDLNKQTVADVLAGATGFDPTVKTIYIEQYTLLYISPSRRTLLVQSLLKKAAGGSTFHLTLHCGITDHCVSPFEHVGRAGALKYLEALEKDDGCSYSIRAWKAFSPEIYHKSESIRKLAFAEDSYSESSPFVLPAGSEWPWGARQGAMSIEKICRP